jgi:DNA polymerase III sliding clamp (beta) subunit (PCNA family)
MLRKELLDTLELVRPALASDNLIPIFQNFCFNEGTVYASKDKLTIMAPCDVQESFAVNGKILGELLKNSAVKEVDIQLDKENALVVAGKSKMKLPYMGQEDFLFTEPEDETWSVILDIDDEVLKAFELCLVTSSSDNTMPAFMGVTVKGGKRTCLYSCDGDALSRYQLGTKSADVQLIVPGEFVDSLLRITATTGCKLGHLYLNEEWAVAELGNDYKIFGRILVNDEPLDFESQLKKYLKDSPPFIEVPDGLAPAISRARVVADPESKATAIKVSGGKLYLNTETHLGDVKDVISIESEHPDISASVSAKLIATAISVCNEMAVFDNCTVYRQGDEFILLVSNYSD